MRGWRTGVYRMTYKEYLEYRSLILSQPGKKQQIIDGVKRRGAELLALEEQRAGKHTKYYRQLKELYERLAQI